MKTPMQVFQELQQLKTKEEMISYLQALPKKDEPWPDEKIIDQWTGAELKPGDPRNCQGNGKHPDFELCCDNCDWYLECFPNWDKEPEYGLETKNKE